MLKVRRMKRGLLALLGYTTADVVCVGMGMGVPVFCILLGLPVGWLIVGHVTAGVSDVGAVLRKVLLFATVTAGVTLAGMAVIWGPCAAMLFDPGADLANFGIPLILYEPRASFIGWLVLMIVISPVLQLLTTLLGSHLALIRWARKRA